MNIKIVRLISGEELLTELLTPTDGEGGWFDLRRPVRIVVVPDKTDPRQPSVGLAPWGEFAAKKDFHIKKEHVLVVYEPVPEFVSQYQQMFGAILTPQKPAGGLILP
jgi:hypothetical protein